MSYVPGKCLEAAKAGVKPPLPFETMFKSMSFDSSKEVAKTTELRNRCMIGAYQKFTAPAGAPLTNVFKLKDDGGTTGAKEPTEDGKLALFVPYPYPDEHGNARLVGSDREPALLRRIDTTPAELLNLMVNDEWHGYFQECQGLGRPSGLSDKWVWLTRCVAPRQYVMVPFTSSDNVRWASSLANGGHRTAQYETIVGDEYISPGHKDDSDVNKRYWAFLLGKIPEFDSLTIPTMVETPAPRAELIAAEAIDQAVAAYQKIKTVVDGSFTAESRDEPAKDKPSALAEVAGAVAVAAGVALATGVVAALV